jgi:hypothetical protein
MMNHPESQATFHEVQHFRQTRIMTILAPAALTLFILFGYFMFKGLVSSDSSDGVRMLHTAPGIIGALVYLLGVGIFCFVFFVMKLKTEVRKDGLHIHFYPLMKRVIRFEEITRTDVRTYRPIREYGGWGIRSGLGKTGGAYNVSGNRGVQLELSGGKQLLVGSQRPEELAKAIQRAMV